MNKIWVLQKVQFLSGFTISFYLFNEKPSKESLTNYFMLDHYLASDLLETGVGVDHEDYRWYLNKRTVHEGEV